MVPISIFMKQRTFEIERQFLSPYAAKSDCSRGRERPIEECPLRTDYQRDRDRLIHCKSFRRLKHKTQVFLSPEGDHYRTRLTHTLEVVQIARTIACGLAMNEDLTEAIALGHDIGHTPFGHAGEEVFTRLLGRPFKHNEHSRRVVEKLENDGKGLNLTWEVRDGIENHKLSLKPSTLEGKIVSYSDRIAYINHDIDDAIRAGILTEARLPSDAVKVLGGSKGERINTLVFDMVKYCEGKAVIALSPEVQKAMDVMYDFMNNMVYTNPEAKKEEVKAKEMLERLFYYYRTHIDKLPSPYRQVTDVEGVDVAVCDYLASMTDRYAVAVFRDLFVPASWNRL